MSETERDRYLALLRQYDSAAGWEMPPDFDRTAAERQFRALATTIDRAAGTVLHAANDIQDASFFGQIFLGGALLVTAPTPPDTVLLRVSNWGQLATVSDEAALTADGLVQIKDLLAQHGYRYIPPHVLTLPYEGNLPTNSVVSWWQRFFDWV